VRHLDLVRPLDRDVKDAGSARVGPVVAPEPPSAPAATAAVPSALRPPFWGSVSHPVYVPRGTGRHTSARRAYPLGGGSGTVTLLRGLAGPPVAPFPLFIWEGSVQLGTPRPVNVAIWSSLGRFLEDLPSILNGWVDHTLIMALGRTLVRLRNEMAKIVPRVINDPDAERLYNLSTAETLRRPLTEEYGVAVADTSTVVASWSPPHLAGSAASPVRAPMPTTPQGPPCPFPPHYGAGTSSTTQPFYGVASGPAASPPFFSGPGYYAPEEAPSQGSGPGYGACFGVW